MNTKAFSLLAIALVGVATPALAYTAAHPHTHMYWRNAQNDQDITLGAAGATVSVDGSSQVSVVCSDVEPFTQGPTIFPPPTVVRDGDEDWGIGGACFSYKTIYGNDTGKTVTIFVRQNDGLAGQATWISCIDVDGDGLCTEGGSDTYVLCDTAGASSGSRNVVAGGPCAVTLIGAADPTLYVLMVSTITETGAKLGGYGTVRITG